MSIQEIKQQKLETALTQKHDINLAYLKSLSRYLSLEQIESLLEFIGKIAGKNKSHAFVSLINAAKALHDEIPDSKRTAYILRWVAEVSKEDAGDAYEELGKQEAARALQKTASDQGINLS